MDNPPPIGAFTAEEVKAFTDEIKEEAKRGSIRALILVSTAVVDEALRRTLQHFLVDAAGSRELLATNGPLGTMSARIQMAEALGLISSHEGKCFHLIRNIRNEYAHRIEAEINPNSFSDRVENLRQAANVYDKQLPIPPDWSHRVQFAAACVNMLSVLGARHKETSAARRSAVEPIDISGEP